MRCLKNIPYLFSSLYVTDVTGDFDRAKHTLKTIDINIHHLDVLLNNIYEHCVCRLHSGLNDGRSGTDSGDWYDYYFFNNDDILLGSSPYSQCIILLSVCTKDHIQSKRTKKFFQYMGTPRICMMMSLLF